MQLLTALKSLPFQLSVTHAEQMISLTFRTKIVATRTNFMPLFSLMIALMCIVLIRYIFIISKSEQYYVYTANIMKFGMMYMCTCMLLKREVIL